MTECKDQRWLFHDLGNRKVEVHFTEDPYKVVNCLCYEALSEWHLGEIATCQTTIAEAVTLATELHAEALALALSYAAALALYEGNPAEVDRLASDLIELATRHNFAYFLTVGSVYRGWARISVAWSLHPSAHSVEELGTS